MYYYFNSDFPAIIKIDGVYKGLINKINEFYKFYKDKMINHTVHEYITLAKAYNYLKDKEVYASINNERVKVKVLDINNNGNLIILEDIGDSFQCVEIIILVEKMNIRI